MTILQIMVIAVVCTLADRARRRSCCRTARATGSRWSTWPSSSARSALLGQTWAQAHLPPTRSAIIMSMEPVFASFFAVWLGGEDLTSRLLRRRRDGAGRDADRRAGAPPARSRAKSRTSLSDPTAPEWARPPYRGPVDTCARCGAELGVGRFCLNCGHPIGAPAPAVPRTARRARARPPAARRDRAHVRAEPRPSREAEPQPEAERGPLGVPVQARRPDRSAAPVVPPAVSRGRRAGTARRARDRRDPRRRRTAPSGTPSATCSPTTRSTSWSPRRRSPAAPGSAGWSARSLLVAPGLRPAPGLRQRSGRRHRDRPADGESRRAGRRRRRDGRPATARDRRHRRVSAGGSTSPRRHLHGARHRAADARTSTATSSPTRPSQMHDGNPATTWRMAGDAHRADDHHHARRAGVISRVGLVNGYAKQVARRSTGIPTTDASSASTWAFDDGTSVEQTFAERPAHAAAEGRRRCRPSTVTLTITSVTPPGSGPLGRDYTAISEVTLIGRNAGLTACPAPSSRPIADERVAAGWPSGCGRRPAGPPAAPPRRRARARRARRSRGRRGRRRRAARPLRRAGGRDARRRALPGRRRSDATCGHLSMVFVDPALWGCGVGGALVRSLQRGDRRAGLDPALGLDARRPTARTAALRSRAASPTPASAPPSTRATVICRWEWRAEA